MKNSELQIRWLFMLFLPRPDASESREIVMKIERMKIPGENSTGKYNIGCTIHTSCTQYTCGYMQSSGWGKFLDSILWWKNSRKSIVTAATATTTVFNIDTTQPTQWGTVNANRRRGRCILKWGKSRNHPSEQMNLMLAFNGRSLNYHGKCEKI